MQNIFLVLMTLAILIGVQPRPVPAAPPQTVAPFRLPDTRGEVVELGYQDTDPWTVICFLGTECPLAKLYGPRLARLAKEFESRQVRFIGINSNRQDSMDEIRDYAKEHAISFAMAKDYGNQVADQFAAQRTPEVVVVDQNLAIRYRGRIDDQYSPGIARSRPSREDLRLAIEQLLAGKPVDTPTTEPVGCFIGRIKTPTASGDVTFCDQVARLFQRHCVECHREGEIGPFSLTSYEESVGWADTILEVVDNGRMPPWHANPDHGHYKNARYLSAAEKKLLHDWVATGAPYGDPEKLPSPLSSTDAWRLAKAPDIVLPMRDRPFVVPADGTVEYQYFVVDPGFEEDKWVTGAQVIPGNRGVVHHSIVFIRPPDGSVFRGVGWLAAYVPGQRAADFPPGRAIRVPARSKLVFQQHYTPNGTEQSDLTQIGIVFGQDQQITDEIFTVVGIDQEFEIPPHASNYTVHANVPRLPEDGELLAIVPHMHLRGKSFRLFTKKDELREILLDVPQYDFNWQHTYELSEPVPLTSIDGLEFTVTFDNSAGNPFNPDPSQHVTWGDQTWEEMAVAFFEVSEPRKKEPQPTPAVTKTPDGVSADLEQRVKQTADRFLRRFDKNQDGNVDRFETPRAIRRFGFYDYDQNGDGKLTRTEIENAARWRIK